MHATFHLFHSELTEALADVCNVCLSVEHGGLRFSRDMSTHWSSHIDRVFHVPSNSRGAPLRVLHALRRLEPWVNSFWLKWHPVGVA